MVVELVRFSTNRSWRKACSVSEHPNHPSSYANSSHRYCSSRMGQLARDMQRKLHEVGLGSCLPTAALFIPADRRWSFCITLIPSCSCPILLISSLFISWVMFSLRRTNVNRNCVFNASIGSSLRLSVVTCPDWSRFLGQELHLLFLLSSLYPCVTPDLGHGCLFRVFTYLFERDYTLTISTIYYFPLLNIFTEGVVAWLPLIYG